MDKFCTGRLAVRNRALLWVGAKTGYRAYELLSLQIKDVYELGEIVSDVYVKRMNMKGKKSGRSIPLNPVAKKYLVAWLKIMKKNGDLKPDNYVFHPQGRPFEPMERLNAYRIIKGLANSAGLTGKIGMHSLRKTFGCDAWDLCGGDITKLQVLMGHKDVNNTIRYMSSKIKNTKDIVMNL